MPFDGRTAAPIAAQMRALVGPNARNWRQSLYWDERRGVGCLMGLILRAQDVNPAELAQDTRLWDGATREKARMSGTLLVAAILRHASERIPIIGTFDGPRDWAKVVAFNDQAAKPSDILPIIDALEEIELERAEASVAA